MTMSGLNTGTTATAAQRARVDAIDVNAYEIPTATDEESDGTLIWDSTSIVVVEITCGDHTGLGYSYCHPSAAHVIESKLADIVTEADPLMPQNAWAQMQMLGNNALIDIAHYAERWTNPQCVIVVLHNNDLNQVTWEQRVLSGDPKLQASQVLPDFPFARYAEVVGLKGLRVERPEDVGAAWDEALAANCPVVYEAITDPEVPPLPPHIRFEQAQKMAMALPGDPHTGRIIKQSLKGKLEEFVTR